jgi:hypothetical protein
MDFCDRLAAEKMTKQAEWQALHELGDNMRADAEAKEQAVRDRSVLAPTSTCSTTPDTGYVHMIV